MASALTKLMKKESAYIENRFDSMCYLQETCPKFDDGQALLEEVVRAMSDDEFSDIYQYICRMNDIEPDQTTWAATNL